jgi:hypothetical protein
MSEWISVEDEEPTEGGRYWCYVEEQTSLGLSGYQWNCSWHEDRGFVSDGEVTYWMPLPKPPIGDKS